MKLRFLLADIGYDCEELNEPLGIEAIISYLKVYSPSVICDLYSANFDSIDYKNLLIEYSPDIIGLSTHINTWDRFEKYYKLSIKYFHDSNKEPIFIVGGILGTYEYATILKDYANVICSIGEGEESISVLLNIASTMNNSLTFTRLTDNFVEGAAFDYVRN